MSRTLWLLRLLEARHARTGRAMEASDLFYRSVLRAVETGALQTFLQFPR
jgi:hypothetical protein